MKNVIAWIVAIIMGFAIVLLVGWLIAGAIKILFKAIFIIIALVVSIPIYLYLKKKFFS